MTTINTTLVVAACVAIRGLMEVAFVYATRNVSLQTAIVWTLPSWLWLAPLAFATIALAHRYSFERRNRVRSAVVHLVACIVFATVHLVGIVPVRVLLAGSPLNADTLEAAFWVAFRLLFYLDLLTYFVIVGMSLTLHHSNLRTSLAEARLAALRAQLNPHFLFNTLNAISTLALKGDQAAVTEMLGRLSGLLRAALEEHTEEIPLARELEFFDDYVAIQQVRFADRLSVEKAVAPDTLHGLVPTMILQPIIENAIKHGVTAQRSGGHVNLSAARQNGTLVIEVRDSGPGFRHGARHDGIGLANTRARLEQLYGSDYRFEYGTVPEGGASVRITVPFRQPAA
jgi:signal transduction histidine kinase